MIDHPADQFRSFLDPRRFPPGIKFYCASDTGTYNSHVIAAAYKNPWKADRDQILVFEEFPNYRYVGGEIELTGEPNRSIAKRLRRAWTYYTGGGIKLRSFVDKNTQFRAEYRNYKITLVSNLVGLNLRTEITREYFQSKDIWLAPWLDILPQELEDAEWPKDTTPGGAFDRIKHHDHTLDCLEHICSRRPRGGQVASKKKQSFLQRHLQQHRIPRTGRHDPHLGRF